MMRPARALLYAAVVLLLPVALGGDQAEAIFECGTFDGKFQCRASQGGVVHGKTALPGVDDPSRKGETPAATAVEPPPGSPVGATPGEHSCPPGSRVLAAPNASGSYCEPPASDAAGSGCGRGMVGTPPNCSCPQNSELLGGNCVRYTATACSNGLAADALPQACRSVEEKVSCRIRADGLKDCCCVLYDKM
jgi:hypothetical protein